MRVVFNIFGKFNIFQLRVFGEKYSLLIVSYLAPKVDPFTGEWPVLWRSRELLANLTKEVFDDEEFEPYLPEIQLKIFEIRNTMCTRLEISSNATNKMNTGIYSIEIQSTL